MKQDANGPGSRCAKQKRDAEGQLEDGDGVRKRCTAGDPGSHGLPVKSKVVGGKTENSKPDQPDGKQRKTGLLGGLKDRCRHNLPRVIDSANGSHENSNVMRTGNEANKFVPTCAWDVRSGLRSLRFVTLPFTARRAGSILPASRDQGWK